MGRGARGFLRFLKPPKIALGGAFGLTGGESTGGTLPGEKAPLWVFGPLGGSPPLGVPPRRPFFPTRSVWPFLGREKKFQGRGTPLEGGKFLRGAGQNTGGQAV